MRHDEVVIVSGRVGAWRERHDAVTGHAAYGAWLSHAAYGRIGLYVDPDSPLSLASLPRRSSVVVHARVRPQTFLALEGDHRIVTESPHALTLMMLAVDAIDGWKGSSPPWQWPVHAVTVYEGRRLARHPRYWVGKTAIEGCEVLLSAPCYELMDCEVRGLYGAVAPLGAQTYLRMLWLDTRLGIMLTGDRGQPLVTERQQETTG